MAGQCGHAAPIEFMDISEVEELEPPASRQLVATYMGIDPGTRNCGVAIARFYHTDAIGGTFVNTEWEFYTLDFDNDYKNIPGQFTELLADEGLVNAVFIEQQYAGGSPTMVSCMQCIYGALAMVAPVEVVHWTKVIKLLKCDVPDKKKATLRYVRTFANYPNTISQHEADAAIQILCSVNARGDLL